MVIIAFIAEAINEFVVDMKIVRRFCSECVRICPVVVIALIA